MNGTMMAMLAAQNREAALPPEELVDEFKSLVNKSILCVRQRDYQTAERWLEGLKTVLEEARDLFPRRGEAVRQALRHMDLTKRIYELEVTLANRTYDSVESEEFIRNRLRDLEEIDEFTRQLLSNSLNYLDPNPAIRV